jgi:hypothetical protein
MKATGAILNNNISTIIIKVQQLNIKIDTR